jgi:hypothetical protein
VCPLWPANTHVVVRNVSARVVQESAMPVLRHPGGPALAGVRSPQGPPCRDVRIHGEFRRISGRFFDIDLERARARLGR